MIMKSKTKTCNLAIPTKVVKQSIGVLATPITNIINSSLSSGVFPTVLKKGLIHPLIKKPDLDSKFQSAYRSFHSTETALLWVFNDIFTAIDSHNEVVLVQLAFDTIDHCLLLSRLHHRFGFTGTVLEWFKSYLNGRTQQVAIKNCLSSGKALRYGVPQGSVLGPLLFSLFFSPLDLILAHGLRVMTYADDTQLYISIDSIEDRPTELKKLELCVNDILIWCSSNGLACNPDKTEIVHLTSRFLKYDPISHVGIDGLNIRLTQEARNFGVTIDKHLQLTMHINNICKSAYHSIRNIGKIRKFLDRNNLERVVQAFITSKLSSCNSLLSASPRITSVNT
ncbi:putative RNA-directed DNA polymerase from transposon BS [Exaiptasia diaphana]|nr:putative RNA-directed DNA polymerase from transposon BS [Exaiptasia diaphana]